MKRYRTVLFAALLTTLAWSASLRAAEPTYKLAVVTDRPEAIYAVGDKVKFTVTLKKDGRDVAEGAVSYTVDKDGVPPANRGTLKLGSGPMCVEGSLAEPGVLRCHVVYVLPSKKPLTALAGAAFDPEKIKPSMPVPEDFDAFWTAQRAKLAQTPMKPVLTPVKSTNPKVECFDVQIPICGTFRPVSAYFGRPIGAKPKSLPAFLGVHGAGVRSSGLGGAMGRAGQGFLAMDLNANGIPNGKPEAFYKELAAGDLKNYPHAGREDRETCYFLGMYLRLIRAMDFLASQPEWDGKIFLVAGSSQGGGQAFVAAGLDPRVTFFTANVPAMCDHSGKAVGRINGWPKIVPDKDGKPDPKILEAARYFDAMNFATRTRADAAVSVGLIDGTCAPTSVYAAFNNLSGKKRMVVEPLMGHASSPKIGKAFAEAEAEHLAKMRAQAK